MDGNNSENIQTSFHLVYFGVNSLGCPTRSLVYYKKMTREQPDGEDTQGKALGKGTEHPGSQRTILCAPPMCSFTNSEDCQSFFFKLCV